jgi:hypothetical protein
MELSKAWIHRQREDPAYRERQRAKELARTLAQYGLTIEAYNRLVAKQEGRCLICHGTPKVYSRLMVDHDHKTDKVRGLLCETCNLLLGYAHADDGPELLLSALEYLEGAVGVRMSA